MNYLVRKRTILQLIAANLCLLFAQFESTLQDYYFVIGLAVLAWAAVEIAVIRLGFHLHISKLTISKARWPERSTAIKISTSTQPIIAQTLEEVEAPNGFWGHLIAWADSPAWMAVIVVEVLLIGFFYLSLQRFLDAHTGFEMFLVWHGF